MARVLRTPANDDVPDPGHLRRGLRNVSAGVHSLNAMASGSRGALVDARPVTIPLLSAGLVTQS